VTFGSVQVYPESNDLTLLKMFLNEARSRPIILLWWYNSSSVGGITIAL